MQGRRVFGPGRVACFKIEGWRAHYDHRWFRPASTSKPPTPWTASPLPQDWRAVLDHLRRYRSVAAT